MKKNKKMPEKTHPAQESTPTLGASHEWYGHTIYAVSERALAALFSEWHFNKKFLSWTMGTTLATIIGIIILIPMAFISWKAVCIYAIALVVCLMILGGVLYALNTKRKRYQSIHKNQIRVDTTKGSRT